MTTIERADVTRSRMVRFLTTHELAVETLAWFMAGNRRATSITVTARFLTVRGKRE